MFKRIDGVKHCGIFENYQWDSSLPDLGRINVIYGHNGAGKTSLANAFDGLRHADDSLGFTRLSIALTDGTDIRSTDFTDDTTFDRVHVFSERYVDRSHRFTSGSAELDAVLTVGERPVDAEERLARLRITHQEKTRLRDEAAQAAREANRTVDRVYARVSQEVVGIASRAGGRWHSRSNFSAGVVRAAFAGSHSDWAELSEDDLRAVAGIINSDKSEKLSTPALSIKVPADLKQRLHDALTTAPSAVILDTLAEQPDATAWVDTGRHLHAEIGRCIFCGSGLSEDRKALIDQHFSNEVERLQEVLTRIADDLDSIVTSCDRALAAIPDKGLFYEDLRSRYDRAAEDARAELAALRLWADGLKSRVETKALNVLGKVNSSVSAIPSVTCAELLDLCSEHNARVERHEDLVQDAAQKVERHHLKRAEAEVETQINLATEKLLAVGSLDTELGECATEIGTLETVEGDPTPTARVLTEEVARLLGRSELKFEAAEGRYRVTRFGEPAVGLSVGERTAITLVHFLECVARFDAAGGKPIVIIDDPVSSLDSDIFMGVSTYIWTEGVVKDHIAQLILLTHNFELFRQWDIQVEGLHRGGRRFTELYSARFFEIRSKHVSISGSPKRRPVLRSWPPSEAVRKKVRSTYHHAFISVAEALQGLEADDSLENRLDAQLLFPNVVRRMLESFLAFKRPEWVGDLGRAMRNSAELLNDAGYRGDANALRLRLTRYVHAHSHGEDPSTDRTVSPDEVETAIRAAFEFMYTIDPPHFSGLCESANIDSSVLLPEPLPEIDDDSDTPAPMESPQNG
jgi:wobble nucleotide-excising tRNase